MKANELQVGDYIRIKPSLLPISISAVHQRKIGYHAHPNKLEWVRQGLLEPIPLTEELLAKNFEKNGDEGYQLDNTWRIWQNPNFGYIAATLTIDDYGGGSYEPCVPIRYLHELQQFLRLLKVQKNIVLY